MAGYNYFAIEGVIGSGKSLLLNHIAKKTGARTIETPIQDNPFLDAYYRDPARYAFQTQIFFLLSRYKLLSSLYELDLFHEIAVSDFIIERDNINAKLSLNEAEFRLYKQVEMHLSKDLPIPQLVILLQTPTEMLVRNILNNGRTFERRYVNEALISHLCQEYTTFFYKWKKTPLLIVDTNSVNLEDDRQIDELSDYILDNRINGTQFYSSSQLL